MTDFPEFDSWLRAGDRADPYADEHTLVEDDIDALLVPAGHRMVMTCGACPEQYELRDADGNMVAYFRLRHGFFGTYALGYSGANVYRKEFKDGWLGIFPSSKSRRKHLQRGIDAAVAYVTEVP